MSTPKASKYDPLDMALSLAGAGTPQVTPSASTASTPSADATSVAPPAPKTRRQLNVRVLEATYEQLRDETTAIAATHSTGDVIDWLVQHHLDDAIQALAANANGRRIGLRPRR